MGSFFNHSQRAAHFVQQDTSCLTRKPSERIMMKRTDITAALETIVPAIASNAPVAELENFLIDGKIVQATDCRTMIRTSLSEDSGLKCLVPALPVYQLLSSLSLAEVDLKLVEDELKIVSGRVRGKFKVTLDAQILDRLDFDVETWAKVPKGLVAALTTCKFSASTDTSRGAVAGVRIKDNQVYSSDGYRISIVTLPAVEGGLENTEMVLPISIIKVLERYNEANVEGWVRKGDLVLFKLSTGTVIATKDIAGKYPDAETFAALEQAKEVTDEITFPDSLSESLLRHVALQRDVADVDRDVTISLEGNCLTIHSSGVGAELEEELSLTAKVEGKYCFGIHPAFLLDILKRTTKMRYSTDQDFVVFSTEGFQHLAMVRTVEDE